MTRIEELMKNEEFIERLNKCESERDMEALREEYADLAEVDIELDEDTLEEISGGGKVCNFFNNCKYICRECHETFATETMANWHWFMMSFKGGGLRHTYKNIK